MEWIGNGTGTLPARFTKRLYAMAANTFMRSTNRSICVKKHQKYRVNQILFNRIKGLNYEVESIKFHGFVEILFFFFSRINTSSFDLEI